MNISKLYLDPRFPGSYSGIDKFYREVKKVYPNVTKKSIQQSLQKVKAYSLHKRAIRPKKFRRTWTHAPRDLWQIDLLDFQKFENENDGMRYLCVIIDCFSKFVWVKPLKNKTAKSIVKSLALLIMTERPKRIMCDQGSEFHNSDVNRMLEAFGPKMYYIYSDKKASIVERVQRTIRNKIGRIFTENGNNNWINHIDTIVHTYNNSYHTSIRMRPAEVTEEHYVRIRLRLYPGLKVKPAKFKVGQKVRIISAREKFSKEYETRWTEEIFRIKAVQETKPVTYLLEDCQKEAILGSFYEAELQNVD
jgi:transposase InsO family protein